MIGEITSNSNSMFGKKIFLGKALFILFESSAFFGLIVFGLIDDTANEMFFRRLIVFFDVLRVYQFAYFFLYSIL